MALAIRSWGRMPDSAFCVFVCDGCGGEDVTSWSKEGVEHWRGNQVCGRFRYSRPYEGRKHG